MALDNGVMQTVRELGANHPAAEFTYSPLDGCGDGGAKLRRVSAADTLQGLS